MAIIHMDPFNHKNMFFGMSDLHAILGEYGVIPRDFHNLSIYQTAFIHRSYCIRKTETIESGNLHCPDGVVQLQSSSYERLEHLGDSVVDCIVAAYLYNRYPDQDEGFLTKTKVKMVNGTAMSIQFKLLNLSKFIVISSQIEAAGGRHGPKINEDVFESFIGALFIDLGFKGCQLWLEAFYEHNIDFSELIIENNNHKDIFIKLCQNEKKYVPKYYYEHVGLGSYTVCVKDDNNCVIANGVGISRKDAENAASKSALLSLQR